MKRKFKYIVITCLLVMSGFQIANACVCIGYRAPCEEYSVADVVVLAKIESISEAESASLEGKGYTRAQKVKVSVKQSFKGTDEKMITLSQPDTSCDRQFAESDKGKTFLLYLDRNKEYTILVCGRSGEVEQAGDDLSWLNALPGSLKRTRFSGVLGHYAKDPQFAFLDYLAGAKVRIFNDTKSYEVTTDKNGLYEVWDLQPGGYKVEPDFPKSYKLYFEMRSGLLDPEKGGAENDPSVSIIRPNGCAVADYVLIDAPK